MTPLYLGTTVSTVPVFLVTWRIARRFGWRGLTDTRYSRHQSFPLCRPLPFVIRRGTGSEAAALSARRLRFTLDHDPLVDADAHLVVGPLAPPDDLGRFVLVGRVRVGVIEVRLHLEPRTLRHADRLLESVGALPVEVPVVDLDQRDTRLAIGQDSREGEVLAEPVHVGHHRSDQNVTVERTGH